MTDAERECAAAVVLAGIRKLLDEPDRVPCGQNIEKIVLIRTAILSLDVDKKLFSAIEAEAVNRRGLAAFYNKKVWEL